MNSEQLLNLFKKHHAKGGRYTFYPLIQQWDKSLQSSDWLEDLKTNQNSSRSIDLYIHIPFCPSLCTFCGCNIKIGQDPKEQYNYIQAIIKEWNIYLDQLGDLTIDSLYLGGGTPTSLSSESLSLLLENILTPKRIGDNFQGSFESDPRLDHTNSLKTLSKFGFKRMSMGVQDFDQKVLKNVNREQSFEQVKIATDLARENGIEEVFYDFIYGLPFQKEISFRQSLEKLKDLSPSGVALYPLAHVPWQRGSQSAFGEFKPLNEEEKYRLLIIGQEELSKQGFKHVGMGHFLHPKSKTGQALKNKSLRRHIMGFTPQKNKQLLGLGVSSISHSGSSLAQNERVLERYLFRLEQGDIPLEHGHRQSSDQLQLQSFYEQLICSGRANFPRLNEKGISSHLSKMLTSFKEDGLLSYDEKSLELSDLGRFFIKNIDQAFELPAN